MTRVTRRVFCKLLSGRIFAGRIFAGCVALSAFAVYPMTRAGAAIDCDHWEARGIPPRSEHAVGGSEFARRVADLSEREREQRILEELMAGNIPDFLRNFKPVRLEQPARDGNTMEVVVCVMPDYLAIGSDNDFLRVPVNLHTALEVARRFGLDLPTAKLVNAIHAQSTLQLQPRPMPPGPQMRSMAYYKAHNETIQRQRRAMGGDAARLIAGHKKDIVFTYRLNNKPERVAIYGWHYPNGKAIQPLSTVHGARYADYSHGLRLVSEKVAVNGAPYSMQQVLHDQGMHKLLIDEDWPAKAERRQ